MPNPGPSRRSVLGLIAASAYAMPAQAEAQVDLALVLAIDCSLSVDEYAYHLQLRGTGQAMLDSSFLQLIEGGNHKVIAISAFLWSSPKAQQVIVPWRILKSGRGADDVADEILSAPRHIPAGATATGNALAFAQTLMAKAPAAARQVIDVSTNGHANMGLAVSPMRDQLVRQGVVINGLAVTDREAGLASYLQREVIGGNGSFVIQANDYNAYTQAIRLKLFREISATTTA